MWLVHSKSTLVATKQMKKDEKSFFKRKYFWPLDDVKSKVSLPEVDKRILNYGKFFK